MLAMRRAAEITLHQSFRSARNDATAAVRNGFRMAIAAAAERIGATAPNPPVGCCILDEVGEVLVVAAHHRAGAPHAEALALRTLAERGLIARAKAMLVTLEPCSHVGRTGPCTEAILASPIRDVWVGCTDDNPRAAGGAARLAAAGCTVRRLDETPEFADLAGECAALVLPFRRWAATGRPWITVKQALDPSGSMIPPRGSTTFTSPQSLLLAHRLRRSTDAIVTGLGTVLADRPALTVRRLPDHPDRHPRMLAILTRHGGIPDDYREAAIARGFHVRAVTDLSSLPDLLGGAGILWAMIEAGPRLLQAVRTTGLWDDWLTIRRPQGDDESPDRLSIASATGPGSPTPLSLLPELASRT